MFLNLIPSSFKETRAGRSICYSGTSETLAPAGVATNIADALGVSLDYLVGRSSSSLKDKKMIERINSILSLDDKDKEHILYTIDGLIRSAKLKTL